jgi:hypothetical protein
MKTRIMIEYRNNGKVFYAPQVKTNMFSGWSYITPDNNISKSVRIMYDDLAKAQSEIENYIKNLDEATGKKVKRVEYINIG